MHEAAPQHWKLIQAVAAEAGVSVDVPVYPLVQAGGTAETVVPIVAELAQRASRPVVLMGDSAGGTIAMSTSLLLQEQGDPADLTVLISPVLDLRMTNPEIDALQPLDPWLVKNGQRLLTEMWIGEHSDNPVLNPIFGDVSGAGRLVIFSGTRDILHPDIRLFVRGAEKSGNEVVYHESPGQLHVYPLLPTPEARAARKSIVQAVRGAIQT